MRKTVGLCLLLGLLNIAHAGCIDALKSYGNDYRSVLSKASDSCVSYVMKAGKKSKIKAVMKCGISVTGSLKDILIDKRTSCARECKGVAEAKRPCMEDTGLKFYLDEIDKL